MIPPATPGINNRMNNFLSTLPSLKWEIPETKVVKTSADFTLALASAGGTPVLKRKLAQLTP